MSKKILAIIITLSVSFSYAQTVPDSLNTNPQNQQNAAQRILSGNINTGVTVGGYGEITYNQPEGDNGELDVQRLVLLFGFQSKTGNCFTYRILHFAYDALHLSSSLSITLG